MSGALIEQALRLAVAQVLPVALAAGGGGAGERAGRSAPRSPRPDAGAAGPRGGGARDARGRRPRLAHRHGDLDPRAVGADRHDRAGRMSGGIAVFGWGALRLFGLLRMQVLWRGALGPVWEGVSAALALLLAAVLLTSPGEPVALVSWLVDRAVRVLARLGDRWTRQPAWRCVAGRGPAERGRAAECRAARGLPLLLAIACVSGGLVADLHRPLLVALRELLLLWPVGAPARWLPGARRAGAVGRRVGARGADPGADLRHAGAADDRDAGPGPAADDARGGRLRCSRRCVRGWSRLRPWIALGAAWAAYPGAWLRAWPALH
jgi:hypothetical protein